jgi:surfactin synthase thioesterase subunit
MADPVTLFCFPFAGGTVYSYRQLEQAMPAPITVVPLEPPGRGKRIHESRLTVMTDIADDLTECLLRNVSGPYALFGHSMGGLSVYLVMQRLLKEGGPLPMHLFISGKGPPHIQSREAQWHMLPQEEFRQKLIGLGGSPAAVFNDRELMDYFAPIIRDDMKALYEYRHQPTPPMAVPMTVLLGMGESTSSAEASQWSGYTSEAFKLVEFDGGHFFLFDHINGICDLIHSTLVVS